jgi:hypothetical protein
MSLSQNLNTPIFKSYRPLIGVSLCEHHLKCNLLTHYCTFKLHRNVYNMLKNLTSGNKLYSLNTEAQINLLVTPLNSKANSISLCY